MNDSASTAFGSLIDIFLEPMKALDSARQHTNWLWYPFLITIVVSVGVFTWYYLTADWNVIVQSTVDYLAGVRHMTPDKIAQIKPGLTRGALIAQVAAPNAIVIPVIFLIQTLYLFLVSKIAGYEVQNFGQWFSFTSWTTFPGTLAFVAMGATYIITGKQATLLSLDVASLNTLLFHLRLDDPWFGLMSSLRLTSFWVWGLMIYGFAHWTRRSLGKSTVIVLAPYAVLYGLWALLILI